MKQQNFNWLLCGCQPITQVATAYLSDYRYTCSAVKAFRRIIKDEYPEMYHRLTEAGFTAKTSTLTPQQLAIVIHFWGMPNTAQELIEKHPDLSRSKRVEKI